MGRYLKKEKYLGVVYLIEAGGLYKIGRTDNIVDRLSGLQTGNGHKVRLICAGRTVYSRQTERLLHKRLASKRVNGEWFDLTQPDIDRIVLYLTTLRPL